MLMIVDVTNHNVLSVLRKFPHVSHGFSLVFPTFFPGFCSSLRRGAQAKSCAAELSAAQAARKPWTQPLASTVREPAEERLAPERRPRISWVLLLNMIFLESN